MKIDFKLLKKQRMLLNKVIDKILTDKNYKEKEALIGIQNLLDAIQDKGETKVLITVEGGIVQSVMSNDDNIKYVIVDYDKNGDERVIVSSVKNPEEIKTEKAYELFEKKVDEDERYVYKKLKKLNF